MLVLGAGLLLTACADSRPDPYEIIRSESLVVPFDRYRIGDDTLLVPRGTNLGYRFLNKGDGGYRQVFINRTGDLVWAVAIDDLGYSQPGMLMERPSGAVPEVALLATQYQEFRPRPLAPVEAAVGTVQNALGIMVIEAILHTDHSEQKPPSPDEVDRAKANQAARERL